MSKCILSYISQERQLISDKDLVSQLRLITINHDITGANKNTMRIVENRLKVPSVHEMCKEIESVINKKYSVAVVGVTYKDLTFKLHVIEVGKYVNITSFKNGVLTPLIELPLETMERLVRFYINLGDNSE